MKTKLAIAASATLLVSVPLAAEEGFENFTLSRNDVKSSSSGAIAGFSSRTRTESSARLGNFTSREPRGLIITIR